MRSFASFKGHPIHPMLIPFPIALLTGAFGFDVISIITHDALWGITASRIEIAGIIMGLVAAIPGALDYFNAVPPRSSGHKRATQHGLLNVGVLVIFTIAAVVRPYSFIPDMWTLVLEALGFGMLCVSGWMGGTLAYRNQIGVDHRYADAGKWQEAQVRARAGEPIVVAEANELKRDQMKLVYVGGQRIAIAMTDKGPVAFADRCTHRGGSLADGVLICGTVQCPWHGSQFDTSDGFVKAGPAREPIEVYTVREEAGHLILELPER